MSEATVNTKRPDGSNRVVITGMGAITPAGVGVEALWKAVMGRECCIRPVERFDTTDYEVHNAGEICGFDATEHGLTKKESRRFERFVQYAIVASDEAIAQAGLSMEDEDPSRVSVVFGSGIGGDSFDQIANSLKNNDPYMVLRDFDSYDQQRKNLMRTYRTDPDRWQRMSLVNIAHSGYFCADRAIHEYARDIWHLD